MSLFTTHLMSHAQYTWSSLYTTPRILIFYWLSTEIGWIVIKRSCGGIWEEKTVERLCKAELLEFCCKRGPVECLQKWTSWISLQKRDQLNVYEERDQTIAFAKSQVFGKLSLTLMRSQVIMLTAWCQNNDFVSPNVDGIMWSNIFHRP